MIRWSNVLALVMGVVAGAVVTTMIYSDRGFTAVDMMEAEALGERRALDASRPSERLESVCAALWLKGQVDQ